jgi:uncharacterized membrane protein
MSNTEWGMVIGMFLWLMFLSWKVGQHDSAISHLDRKERDR